MEHQQKIVEFRDYTIEITLPKSVAFFITLLSNTALAYNLYPLACTIEILFLTSISAGRLRQQRRMY